MVCVSSTQEGHLYCLAMLCREPQHRFFYLFQGFSVVSSTLETGGQSCMFFDQIVHKHIRPNVSPHQTRRANVCRLRLEGPRSIRPAGFGESTSQRWEETTPRLQPGQLRPADVAWWENSKYLNTQEGFWWVGADLAVLIFNRTDLKSMNHFNLFWDLCCVTFALKESFVNILWKMWFSAISWYFAIFVHILICW